VYIEQMASGFPPSLRGGGGGSTEGFGGVGEAVQCYQAMSRVLRRLGEIRDHVEADGINVEQYVKEIAVTVMELTKATGRMFEQEHLRFINMATSINPRTFGGGSSGVTRGIMEHKVIQNLKAVNGDKGLFRQWHQKFTTALGQVNGMYEEMVHRMAREIDLGKDMAGIMGLLRDEYQEYFKEASGDIWKILIDKTEAEAYDKIKMIAQGDGLRAYGVVYRWFTDVSGLGLAEQARRLMHPDPPKREDELAEHVEMWQDKMRRLEAHGDEYRLAPVFKIRERPRSTLTYGKETGIQPTRPSPTRSCSTR
jgi:hypothetical protein